MKWRRIHSQVGESVFGCYDRGIHRKRSEAMLAKLRTQVAELNHSRTKGDLWSGIAFSHALACRWEQVPQPVQKSIEHFEAVTDSNRFELAHTQWLDLWANWHLGRWDVLTRLSDSMFDDATRRSDLFQQLVTTGGFGGAAWLVRDKMEELTRIQTKHGEYFCEQKQTQMFHVFDWITSMQSLLYAGDYAAGLVGIPIDATKTAAYAVLENAVDSRGGTVSRSTYGAAQFVCP